MHCVGRHVLSTLWQFYGVDPYYFQDDIGFLVLIWFSVSECSFLGFLRYYTMLVWVIVLEYAFLLFSHFLQLSSINTYRMGLRAISTNFCPYETPNGNRLLILIYKYYFIGLILQLNFIVY